MRTTDVLVIGSGFGGLSAGALAAASGLDVVVAEQHSRPGGCAGDFALDGWWFPAGATVVTGLEPGGILRQVFEASGTPFESAPLDPSIELNIAGQKVRYVADHGAWLDEFLRAFPGAGPGYRRFWEWVERTGGTMYRAGNALPSFPIESANDVRRSLGVVSLGAIGALPDMVRTVAAVKQRLGAAGCADADALIDGLLMDATGATAETCSAAQGALALDIYRRGCQWVEGGTATLAMGLVRSIRRQGGEVRFLSRVTRLLPGRNGWRVVFDDGTAMEARTVVANVAPGALDRMLGNGAKQRDRPDSWGAFVLHLGIDASGLEDMHPFQQVIDAAHSSAEGGNCLVSIFPGKGKRDGRWSLSVSTHTRVAQWLNAGEGERACLRGELEERLVDAVEAVIPDVRSRIRLQRSAIPGTFERYTLRADGYVGGPVQRPGFPPLTASGHRPARRMFLAGDHVFPGQGTVGVALSGINAYRDACDTLGVRALL